MTALRKSLIKLDHVVAKLEKSVSGLEGSLIGQQRDMFAGTEAAPVAPMVESAQGKVDGAVVAQALDKTIARVEKLLAKAA